MNQLDAIAHIVSLRANLITALMNTNITLCHTKFVYKETQLARLIILSILPFCDTTRYLAVMVADCVVLA